jgi:hypothetical protein
MWMTVRRFLCVHHRLVISAEPHKIFLRCTNCGYRTAGWNLDARAENAVRVARQLDHPLADHPHVEQNDDVTALVLRYTGS